MAQINLDFRSRGAGRAISEIQRLQASLNTTTDGVVRLARQFDTTFAQARRFANNIGLTADQAAQAVDRIRELRSVNATAGEAFRALNRELGLTREQFLALNGVVRDLDLRLTNEQILAIAASLGVVAIALGEVGRQSLRTFATLESSLNQFAAISSSTDQQLQLVDETILELGSTSANTANEIALAAVALARIGFSAEEVSALLPAVNASAIATATSIESLADIVATAVNQFNESEGGQRRFIEVSDLLVQAANSSATNILELGEALRNVGPSGNQAGQSIETVVTTLGLFANAGIRGAEAGTALSNIFIRLRNAAVEAESETNEAANAFRELNIDVLDSTGQLRDFVEILPEILRGLREIENVGRRGILIGDIFGVEEARRFSALLNLTEEQFESFVSTIEESAGASERASERLLSGFSGSLTELNSALEATQVIIGRELAESVEPAVRAATDLLRVFTELPVSLQKALLLSGAFVTTFTAATAVVIGLRFAIDALNVSSALLAARTQAATIAQGINTAATRVQAIAMGELNIVTLAATLQAGAYAAIQRVAAIATGATTAAVITLISSLGTLLGALALLAAPVIALNEVFFGLQQQTSENREALQDLDESYAEFTRRLAEVRVGVAETRTELEKLSEVNLESLNEDIGLFRRLIDSLNAPLGIESFLQRRVEAEAGAFFQALTQLQQLNQDFLDLRDDIEETGDINREELELFIDELEEAAAAIRRFNLVSPELIRDQQRQAQAFQDSADELRELIAARGDEVLAIEDEIEANENLDESLEQLNETRERNLINLGNREREQLIRNQQLLNQGVISQEEFERRKLEITRERLQEELNLIQGNIDRISELNATSVEQEREKNDRILNLRARLLDLTLRLLETEKEAEEDVATTGLENRREFFNQVEASVNRIRSLVSDRLSLFRELDAANEASINAELEALNRGLEIRRELNQEESELSSQERRNLVRELRDLGISTRTSELSLVRQINKLEETRSQNAIARLEAERQAAETLLRVRQRQAEIDAQRFLVEAQQRRLEAERGVAGAAPGSEELQLQQNLLELAEKEIELAEENISNLQETVMLKEQIFELEQQTLALEERNRAASDRAGARERTRLVGGRGRDFRLQTFNPDAARLRLEDQQGASFLPPNGELIFTSPDFTEEIERQTREVLDAVQETSDSILEGVEDILEPLAPPEARPPTTQEGTPLPPPPPLPGANLNLGVPGAIPGTNETSEAVTRGINQISRQLDAIAENFSRPTINNNEFVNKFERPDDREILRKVRSDILTVVSGV